MRRHSHLSSLRQHPTTELALELRHALTPPERRLWYYLRAIDLPGVHWRKQAPLGPYIVDFLCESQRLVIELDGGSHSLSLDADRSRTAWLQLRGYRVVRFWNDEVMGNVEGVVAVIWDALAR
jgi:very-short-patch-repair endonuclease